MVKLLECYFIFEIVVFLIVGWVGVKMVVLMLVYFFVVIILEDFLDLVVWKLIFWLVMIIIGLGGYIIVRKKEKKIKRV